MKGIASPTSSGRSVRRRRLSSTRTASSATRGGSTTSSASATSAMRRRGETLLGWIKQGCPKGDEKDLPAKKGFVDGWRIGKPDAVFEMREAFTVPAKAPKGGIEYKYFGIETNYDEDRWIQAAEAKPGNPG